MAPVQAHSGRFEGSALGDGPHPADVGAVLAAAWRSALPTAAELRRARRRLHAKALVIAAVVVGSYWGLVVADGAPGVRVACAATLVTGLVAVATNIMHDANHGAFSQWRWLNRLLGYTSDALGASSWLWRFKHNNLHHGNTNVVGFDSDISQAPFARLAEAQPWRPWHRFQHVYLWFLYGFMGLKNVLIGDLRNLTTARIGEQELRQRPRPGVVIRLVAGKFGHIGWAVVVPLLFNPWWKVVVFYLACSWVVAFMLAVTFQLAHCVDAADFTSADAPRRGDDFVAHQLLTTVDITSRLPLVGHVFRWLVGGLDHQVEHHLAPRLPHTVYPLLAKRFRRSCREIGVRYRLHHGIWSAVRSHARWLKMMGQPFAPSQPCPVGAGS
jgi:linoleoyl-CoA desaturase